MKRLENLKPQNDKEIQAQIALGTYKKYWVEFEYAYRKTPVNVAAIMREYTAEATQWAGGRQYLWEVIATEDSIKKLRHALASKGLKGGDKHPLMNFKACEFYNGQNLTI